MPANVLGKRLRQARSARGLSQAGLAQALAGAVTQSAVSYWESGRSMPTVENLRDLCGVLGISADRLLGLDANDASRGGDRLARQLDELPPARRKLLTALLPHLRDAPKRR